MKKGIWSLIVFLLPIFTGFLGLEYMLRNIPNSYQTKNDQLTQKAKDLKVLILGHSQNFFGLNPQYFTNQAFNAAHVSQIYSYDKQIFMKFMEEMQSLEHLILPVTYTSFYDEGKDNIFINKNYVLYYGLSNQMNWKYAMEMHAYTLRHNLKRVYDYWVKGEIEFDCTMDGFGTGYSSVEKSDLQEAAMIAAKRHYVENKSFKSENIEAFEDLVKTAISKNIQVILITPPVHKSYYELIDIEKLNKTKELAENYAKKETLVRYIDFQCYHFNDSDFYDTDHLNDQGAKKLSIELNRRMEELTVSDEKPAIHF